jgi:hypothetical protein
MFLVSSPIMRRVLLGLLSFGKKEFVASLITIGVATLFTISLGWMVSAVATPLFAFFFFRFLGSRKESKKAGVDSLCSGCNQKLTWVPEYSRYCCYTCQKYPPKCPTCGRDLFWFPQYGSLYCNTCEKYVEERKEEPKRRTKKK